MIIDNYIAEQFIDPATAPWTPLTAITATISIWSVIKWVKTKVVDDASCTNDWEGYYSYLFTAMQPSTFYMYEIVPSATAYRVSGWIDYRLQNLSMDISDIRWGGGWFSINYGAINSHTTKKANEVIEEIKKSKTDLSWIENTLNEISSQNDIANNNIIDTIKETGIEVSSDVIRKSKELETSNVKTRNLVRQKTKKIDENVSKLSDRQDLTDKKIEDEADEIEEQIEKILEQEADMIENEINTQFEREADEIESNLS